MRKWLPDSKKGKPRISGISGISGSGSEGGNPESASLSKTRQPTIPLPEIPEIPLIRKSAQSPSKMAVGVRGLPEIPEIQKTDDSPSTVAAPASSADAPAKPEETPAKGANPRSADAAAARREGAKVIALRQPAKDWSAEDWQGLYDERAGIAEFDGGLSRPEAEARAFEHCVAAWLYRNPVTSPPGPCLVCSDGDRAGNPLLAIGLGGGQVWLHRECSTTWRVARVAQAIAALAAMGVWGSK